MITHASAPVTIQRRSRCRRFEAVCAPGYQGRKRGEVVRSRTVILQAHTHQFLGTFGASGNGDYRGELRRAIQVITSYATYLGLHTSTILVRLDGLYGDAAPLLDVLSADLGVIARSRAYHLLDLDIVRQRLPRAPDHASTHPESGWCEPCMIAQPFLMSPCHSDEQDLQPFYPGSHESEWHQQCQAQTRSFVHCP